MTTNDENSTSTNQPAAPTESKRRGRRRVLDDVKRGQVCALIAMGCSHREAARYVGCAPSTIRHTMERDRQFLKQVRNADLQAELVPLKHLHSQLGKSWRAAAWLLERTIPVKYVRRSPNYVTMEIFEDLARQWGERLVDDEPDPEVRERLFARIRRWEKALRKKTKEMNPILKPSGRRRGA